VFVDYVWWKGVAYTLMFPHIFVVRYDTVNTSTARLWRKLRLLYFFTWRHIALRSNLLVGTHHLSKPVPRIRLYGARLEVMAVLAHVGGLNHPISFRVER
jgi:hypothetical protein